MNKESIPARKKWHEEEHEGYTLIVNEGGKNLSYSKKSGIRIIEDDGYAFKDLNGDGILNPYEDWRLPVEERLADLISRMNIDQKLGLSLHDGMFTIMRITPEVLAANPFLRAKLGLADKKVEDINPEDVDPTEPTETHKELIETDNMRCWLLGAITGPEYAVRFNNKLQALAEGCGLGIPVLLSTNPRAFKDAHSDTADRDVSCWPSNLGMGATFDSSIAEKMAEIVSSEYRSMGITIELGPEADLASDPRWSRMGATFGSDPKLCADMIRAICDGYQTTEGSSDGWGEGSVVAMCKHWPGSTGEGGRESHSDAGKYAIYPNDKFEDHIYPWLKGGFKLNGPTKQCGAVMSCYDVPWNVGNEGQVGSSFNKYVIDGLLRKENGFEGFVCTDFWLTGYTRKERASRPFVTSWGMADVSPEERALREWESGVDQCGGTNEVLIMQRAYTLAAEKHGKEWADNKADEIASRVLRFAFRVGSFENPYRDPDEAMSYVGSDELRELAMKAHARSIVMLKNKNVLPISNEKKVYIAQKGKGGIPDRAGNIDPITFGPALDLNVAGNFLNIVQTPEEADIAIVVMDSPSSGSGYDKNEKKYIPISLQYEDYKAVNARSESISGDVYDGVKENRSYKDVTVSTYNKYDLDNFRSVKAAMGDKPVIVILRCTNPLVPAEFEPDCDGVLVTFTGLPEKVLLETLTGKNEPSGLLPFQMPASMDDVEQHFEDTARDIKCYTDSEGHCWDFAYGMNYSGVINDWRVETYR